MFAVPAAAAAPVSAVISTNRSFATEREEVVLVFCTDVNAFDVFNRIALINANACDVTFILCEQLKKEGGRVKSTTG